MWLVITSCTSPSFSIVIFNCIVGSSKILLICDMKLKDRVNIMTGLERIRKSASINMPPYAPIKVLWLCDSIIIKCPEKIRELPMNLFFILNCVF